MKHFVIFLILCTFVLSQEITQKSVDDAIKKGVNFLLSKQNSDGFWKGKHSDTYPMGKTALVVLTLIKSDISPKSKNIEKAFKYLDDLPLRKTYSVALYIMATEAKYYALGKELSEKKKAFLQKRRQHPFRILANRTQQKRMVKAVKFLTTSTSNGLWAYPGGNGDLSNTQYALLGLFAAERLGLPVDKKVYYKVARYFIKEQQQDGPKIRYPFVVPAADQPIDLKWRERVEKDTQKAKIRPNYSASKIYPLSTSSKIIMRARGWKYNDHHGKINGSMTTAGVACMVIAKAYLETWHSKRWKKLLPAINESIRDGCAWVAHNFKVNKNPNGGHLYYYLYGLERAGVLTGVELFATHNWYIKGAEKILKDLKKNKKFGSTVDTCFALLFLKRATVPIRLETKMEK